MTHLQKGLTENLTVTFVMCVDRCKCNGHGSSCELVRDQTLKDQLICKCEHFTNGPNCDECLPFYNDRPWARANEKDANECLRECLHFSLYQVSVNLFH